MIVQCPECSTKFSVDTDKVSRFANPKFHCSRCDHYFELHSKRKPAAREASNAGLDRVPAQLDLLGDNAPTPPAAARMLAPDSGTTPSGAAEDWSTKPLFEREPSGKITARWPDSLPTSSFEADMRSVLDNLGDTARSLFGPPVKSTQLTPKTPSERVTDSVEPSAIDDAVGPVFSEQSNPVEESLSVMRSGRFTPLIETKTTVLSNDDVDEFTLGDIPPTVNVTPLSGRVPQLALVSTPRKRGTPDDGPLLEKKSEAASVTPPFRFPRPEVFSRWSGVGVALSLPTALLVLFGAWSISFDYTPEAFASVTRLDGADLPRVAPSGLDVVSTQSDWIGLDSGQRVFQVKGQLVNSTDRAYRDLTVEIKLFDRENNKIASLVVPATSGISGLSSVMALTPETIEELQHKVGVSRTLRTGEQLPFRAIVTSADERAVWFSVRVYSVKRAAS